MMKKMLLLALVLLFVTSGCHSVLTPKHVQAVDLAYENAAEYYSRIEDAPTTTDPDAPIPADVVMFLEANLDNWRAMYAIAHWKDPADVGGDDAE